jgi:hypothetical protein
MDRNRDRLKGALCWLGLVAVLLLEHRISPLSLPLELTFPYSAFFVAFVVLARSVVSFALWPCVTFSAAALACRSAAYCAASASAFSRF